MNTLINNLDQLVVNCIENYNKDLDLPFKSNLKKELAETLKGLYGNEKLPEEFLDSLIYLVNNDLDIGDAYYTKTDGEPTLKKFMINEARLRQANESRGRMKNKIDNLFLELVGSSKKCSTRVTNIDSLSAYFDRLATERIKEYNFKNKQNKLEEAQHQVGVVREVKQKIKQLFNEVHLSDGYNFVGEKRTFDEVKLIQDVNKILKENDKL